MRLSLTNRRTEQGSTLLTVVVVGAILCVAASSMLLMSSDSVSNSYGRSDWDKAFYIAENAVVWAAQTTFDSTNLSTNSYYSTAAGTLPTNQLTCPNNADVTFSGAWVQVTQPGGSTTNTYVITASARVNNKIRTLQAQVTLRPVSQVFDYEYFLNNWGWWWGSTITGNGGQRANWDFDFRDGPTVNGSIYAADQVDENEVPIQNYPTAPFGGLAGADETNLVHQGAPRVTMPNLLNFSNYTALALANTNLNGLWVSGHEVVAGVLSNSYASNPGGNAGNLSPQEGLYVVGTSATPIVIKGTVVIPGDLVIQGVVTGQGTLYVGGNLYIAGNLTYANGPSFSTPPETQTAAQRDSWVAQNATNDLVAYAVRGSILAGDVTNPDWINYCFDYPGSGLEYVGDESHLGQDGIEGTPDDNTPFLHANGTTSSWYDADGDGTTNSNYSYNNDVNMTSTRASYIQGYPTTILGTPVAYSSVASDNMGTLQGIFYTDHAAAMRLAQSTAIFNGVIVSRNEQIVFQNYLDLVYDSRVNSRYNSNPNQYINLGLPWGKPLQVTSFAEVAPNGTGL